MKAMSQYSPNVVLSAGPRSGAALGTIQHIHPRLIPPRYGNYVKQQLVPLEELKKKMLRKREDFDEALKKKTIQEVLLAMSAELRGLSTGRWFVCRNGYDLLPSFNEET